MKRRGLRLTLFVLFIAALGGAVYGVWTFETRIVRDRAARDVVAGEAARAALALAELRASQQAYVAVGQSADFWTARVTSSLQAVQTALDGLREDVTVDEARAALESAGSTLKDFTQVDRRAREQLALNQTLFASDLIFADGLEMLRATAAHLENARQAQDAALTASLGAQRRNEAYVLAGALLLTLVVTLLLLPAGARETTAAPSASAGTADTPAIPRTDTDDSLGAAIDAGLAGSSVRPESKSQARRLDLGATADLCTDLARITDTKDLPSLLARAARILDASGIVLWVADPAGVELLPSMAHGYPAQALSRLGAVRRESDNATAAAFRSGRLQVVASEAGQNGAIIAPLLTVSGCMGVMAVEVKNQGERDDGVRAATSIVAAQLATFVSAPPAAAGAPAADPRAKAESAG